MRLKIIVIALLLVAFGTLGVVYFKSSNDTSGTTIPPSGATGAATSDPKGVTEDQMVRAYVDLATLAETVPIGTPEYEKAKTRVLGEIGLEPGQIEKSLAEFNEHPEKWRPIWDRIQSELSKRNPLPTDSTGTTQSSKKSL